MCLFFSVTSMILSAQNWVGTIGTGTTLYRSGKIGIGFTSTPSCSSSILEVDSAINVTGQLPAYPSLLFNCDKILYSPSGENLYTGFQTGTNNVSGINNSFFGQSAGNSNRFGNRNTYLGRHAAEHNDGDDNVVIGNDALAVSTATNGSVFIGSYAGGNSMTTETVAIGFEAGHEMQMPTNTVIGYRAARNADWANENVVIGYNAASQIISSSANTMVGYLAGSTVEHDYGNTFIGATAGSSYIGSGSDGFNTTLGVNTVVDNFIIGSTAIGQSSRVCDDYTIVLGSNSSAGTANETIVIGDCQPITGNTAVFQINDTRGAYTTGGWNTPSDERLKTNMTRIENPLEIIEQLNGYTYNFSSENIFNIKFGGKTKAGFSAQELLNVFPYPVTESETGPMSVEYDQILPLLLEAIKAQQKEINTLKEALNIQPEEKEDVDELSKGELKQNNPNPFIAETKISYEIASAFSKAEIRVYNLSGELKYATQLQEKIGEVVLAGDILLPGIYAYNLIVDGVSVDTKTMVVAK